MEFPLKLLIIRNVPGVTVPSLSLPPRSWERNAGRRWNENRVSVDQNKRDAKHLPTSVVHTLPRSVEDVKRRFAVEVGTAQPLSPYP